MSKRGSVWVVEQGTYSDYRVVGVFTSRAAAQLVADEINRGDNGSFNEASVDKWALDPAVAELRKGYRQFIVQMLVVDGINGDVHVWERTKAPAYKGTNTPDVLRAEVWAKDEKHAVKIANEHRLALFK